MRVDERELRGLVGSRSGLGRGRVGAGDASGGPLVGIAQVAMRSSIEHGVHHATGGGLTDYPASLELSGTKCHDTQAIFSQPHTRATRRLDESV